MFFLSEEVLLIITILSAALTGIGLIFGGLNKEKPKLIILGASFIVVAYVAIVSCG